VALAAMHRIKRRWRDQHLFPVITDEHLILD
jgi:hypothetical protein